MEALPLAAVVLVSPLAVILEVVAEAFQLAAVAMEAFILVSVVSESLLVVESVLQLNPKLVMAFQKSST